MGYFTNDDLLKLKREKIRPLTIDHANQYTLFLRRSAGSEKIIFSSIFKNGKSELADTFILRKKIGI